MTLDRIAVIGAGAWGTALASVAVRAGRPVSIWDHDAEILAGIAARRESSRLPGVAVDARIVVAATLEEGVAGDAVLLVVPAQVLRHVMVAASPHLRRGVPVVACAKGIEQGTRKFMTEIIAEQAPHVVPTILSGPSFAIDVAKGLPTAVTVAAKEEATAAALSHALSTPTFRAYHATDVRGVEIGGAAKNVLAIAAGIVTGKSLGASAAAALITRGFAELVRFGKALGARPETLMGLSGLGDLVLTCSSPQSRNFSLGVALGQGRELQAVLGEGKLAEGAYTATVLADLAAAHEVEMPIAGAVAAVVDGRLRVDAAIEALLARPVGAEG